MCQDERLIEDQHNERKAQIDNFFDNLRRKVETEKTQKEQDAEENKQKTELKDRVRQHQRRIAEERKHTTVENVDKAELWPL